MGYVIVGNSAAGIGAVEGIRQIDPDGEITVITDEPYHTYSRPLISYLLLGKTTEGKMRYRGARFYEENACHLRMGKTVVGVDAQAKCVFLEDGERVPYDKLLIATGSSAFVPTWEGLDEVEDAFHFMSLDDAKRLNAALEGERKKVLIIGAGLIGLKCAEGILHKASQVTVVDLAPRILSSILDEGGAEIVQNHLEGKGLSFRLASVVKRFSPHGALLESGEELPFDLLVLAVGVRPNASLLRGIAKIDGGIVVNARSETGVGDVYAAGDCTQTNDASDGKSKVMALLPNAYRQGECAGVNMAGGDASFDKAIPMNAIGFFGLHLATAGRYEGKVYEEGEGGVYKRLFYGDNYLNGFILIGNVERSGIYTDMIRKRTPLDSLDFPLVCREPGLMAFSKEDRKVQLGGGRG